MQLKKLHAPGLFRPASLFLPAALLVAALLGREGPAMGLFIVFYAVKLCSLATSDALRAAFAVQPSVKYVQGSGLMASAMQLPGALLAAFLLSLIPETRLLWPMVPCGLLLNLEHVFYEYLYAVGDNNSATFTRGITAVLTLMGLLLCAPPTDGLLNFEAVEFVWLWCTAGLSALVALAISLTLGGRLHPAPNPEVFRHTPVAMLQSSLYPALALTALVLIWPGRFTPAPLLAGLVLYEACRTPFRRAPQESRPMNRLLAIVAVAALLALIASRLIPSVTLADDIAMTGLSLLIAALCAFCMYGSLRRNTE